MFQPSNQTVQASSDAFLLHVQGLRAIAVLTVLIHHINPSYLPGGYLGVDIFFVISGFLITSHIEKQRTQDTFTLSGFYFRRIRRIIPNQLVVIVAVLVASYILLDRESFQITAASAAYSAGVAANFYFLENSGYFAPAATTMPLLHMWSLAVEEQFYLIWPATILGLAMMNSRVRSWVVVGAALGLLLVTEWMVRTNPTAAFYMTPFRIIEFGCGAVLAFWRPRFDKGASVLALAALGVLAACLVLYSESTPFPGLMAIVPCAATTALILWGNRGLSAPLLSNPVAVAIGDRSYALYLVHWPVIVLINLTYPTLGDAGRVGVVLLVTLALTEALYRFWEKPLRYVALPSAKSRRVYGLIVAGALISIAGLAAYAGRAHLTNDDKPTWGRIPALVGCANANANSTANCQTDILVVGDSHSDVVGKAIQPITDKRVARSSFVGCPPIFDVVREYTPPRAAHKAAICDALRKDWKEDLARSPAKTIFLAARWGWLTEPGDYGGETILRGYLLNDRSQTRSTELSRAVLQEGLDETVRALIGRGKTIVLVAQAPVRTNAEVVCSKANAGEPDVNDMCRVVAKQEALARIEFTNRTIRELGEKYPELRVVIPSDELCAEECDMVRDGVALYKDNNHLSDEGAVIFGKAALRSVLNGN